MMLVPKAALTRAEGLMLAQTQLRRHLKGEAYFKDWSRRMDPKEVGTSVFHPESNQLIPFLYEDAP